MVNDGFLCLENTNSVSSHLSIMCCSFVKRYSNAALVKWSLGGLHTSRVVESRHQLKSKLLLLSSTEMLLNTTS